MKKALFIVLSSLCAVSAYASYTTCSTSGLYYDATEVDRGIPPRFGDQLGARTLLINNQVVDSFTYYYQQKPALEYLVSFGNDQKILDGAGSLNTSYSVTMSVSKRDGSDVVTGQKTVTAKVLCERSIKNVP